MAIASTLSLDELRAYSLGTIGLAKHGLGDPAAFDDLEASYELALAAKSPIASHAANNLAVMRWNDGDVESWRELISDSRRLAERFGDMNAFRWAGAELIGEDYFSGVWDEALSAADQFIADCEAGRPHYLESMARAARSGIRLARGDSTGALDDVDRMLAHGREAKDPQSLVPALKVGSRAYAELGRVEDARLLAESCSPWTSGATQRLSITTTRSGL